MIMTCRSVAAVGLAVGLMSSTPVAAQARVDAHAVYETKCMSCHNEHGADLARQRFALSGEKLQVNRTGTAVDRLLRRHHGVKLTDAEAVALIRLFKSGLQWGGAFQRRCARCHDKGVTFARSKLTLRDGAVRISKDGGDVAALLAGGHGEATPAEVETLMEMLRYQLETAPK